MRILPRAYESYGTKQHGRVIRMFQLGKIIQHKDNKITIELNDEVNEEYLKMLARGKENFVQMKFLDNDPKTIKQNALSHALIKDIADWYSDVPILIEHDLKFLYDSERQEDFNHTLATKDDMNQWLDFLIELIIREGVPLKKRYEYLLENNSFFYFSCKYRKCSVCGKPHAQIHHVTAVGNRARNNVDHRKFPFASLCWKHHVIAHMLGEIRFLKDYDVKPVFLDREALIKIGITSNAQLLRFDEKYETEELYEKAIEMKLEELRSI